MTINGPSHFYELLKQKPQLEKEIEALSAITRTAKAIPHGCKCNKTGRQQAATETYVNVLQKYLTEEDKIKIKETILMNMGEGLFEQEIVFKHYDLTNGVEKTTLTIK